MTLGGPGHIILAGTPPNGRRLDKSYFHFLSLDSDEN